ncbi:Acetyltransferase (isoleucine patch superfamily) [Actinopolymorpha singaporensis]|uniref:Acetyltransferase (Isoleucine patch superfamily) n=1 Tax=Actinopolymorpha singaporensis TaxID=117157 RepID=A0A1H1Y8Y8_9ACTN|nr:Acetyltransferase (isoleucine patch superfamily) [Actinopolymorpha singaporensis]
MVRRSPDPRQARFLTPASLRWVIRHRAWTPYYLLRYWRFLLFRLRHPHVVTEGFVFLGRRVQVRARRGYGRLVLGRWVHLGDGTRLHAHEGTLRIGDKCVLGRDVTVNCYLDVEIGRSCLFADWVYVCDFDHVTSDLAVPIKDQGLVKSPVRIGPDCWLGTKVTVVRGTTVGTGAVLAAHAVVRGEVPDFGVAAGVPARIVKNRRDTYAADAGRRAYLEGLARGAEEAAGRARGSAMPAGSDGGAEDSADSGVEDGAAREARPGQPARGSS